MMIPANVCACVVAALDDVFDDVTMGQAHEFLDRLRHHMEQLGDPALTTAPNGVTRQDIVHAVRGSHPIKECEVCARVAKAFPS